MPTPPAADRSLAAARLQSGYSEVASLSVPAATNRPDGEALFIQNCTGCHGARGAGDGPAGTMEQAPVRNLQRPESYVAGAGPLALFRTIKYGLDGTLMVRWEGRLSDAEIWSIVHYVRTLQHVPASPPSRVPP